MTLQAIVKILIRFIVMNIVSRMKVVAIVIVWVDSKNQNIVCCKSTWVWKPENYLNHE